MPQANNQVAQQVLTPNWGAIANKRMSELTPEEQLDAREFWLRHNAGHCNDGEHIRFVLNRIDQTRAAAAEMARALQYITALCSEPNMEWSSLEEAVKQSSAMLAKYGFGTADATENSIDQEVSAPAPQG